jgi:aminoglycoside phosphotransferase (APT) family kinase protein
MIEAAEDVRAALIDMGLMAASDRIAITELTGGVSCDVFRVDLPGRQICVKRALPKLRVAANWRAPPERAEAEVAWLGLVAGIDSKLVPKVLGEDRKRHMFAMEFLAPEQYPLWKAELLESRIDLPFAATVGAALARIHRATAGRADIAAQFDHRAQFHALRIEPYLLYTADRNPDVAPAIRKMADAVATSSIAIMQGDISPKNVLQGPDGPVFLDAETACIGDPAFDLAFCLNHLLLKGARQPADADALAASFGALKEVYLDGVNWEARTELDIRAAQLLSALLLARIDGKSPVEYLTDESVRNFVRARAKMFLAQPALTLDEIARDWTEALRTQS